AVGEAGTPHDVLQQPWDYVLQGIDYDIAGRRDKVGPGANRFVGHHGPPKVKWRQLRQLQKTANVFYDILCFLSSIVGQDQVLTNIGPCYRQLFPRGLDGLTAEDFDYMVDAIVGRAEYLTAAARGASERSWRSWAQAAFNGGAKAAHAASKVRAQQELVAPETDAKPYILADRTVDEWKRIWATHGLEELPLPTDAPTWEELPSLTVHDLRQAIRSFSLVNASGPTRIPPKALEHLSDEALSRLAQMFKVFGLHLR
ncbi:unnamed protein product, partial [Prorocentrum cordatum]